MDALFTPWALDKDGSSCTSLQCLLWPSLVLNWNWSSLNWQKSTMNMLRNDYSYSTLLFLKMRVHSVYMYYTSATNIIFIQTILACSSGDIDPSYMYTAQYTIVNNYLDLYFVLRTHTNSTNPQSIKTFRKSSN